MMPLMMSSTLSAEDLKNLDSTPDKKSVGKTNQPKVNENQNETGRPKKEESELSTKTI